jgi:capsular exopolysaccharide synthesis family protein
LGPVGAGDWSFAPSPVKAINLMTYLHALRRHWISAVAAGTACGLVAFIAVFLVRGAKYEAKAQLQISAEAPYVVQNPDARSQFGQQVLFEILRDTHQGLLRSRSVLQVALRPQTWEKQPAGESRMDALPPEQQTKLMEFNQTQKNKAVDWLVDHLQVRFPYKQAELMDVSVVVNNPDLSAALVNAVVRAYWTVVVAEGRKERQRRLSQLDQASGEKEQDVRNRTQQLKDVAEQYGTSESEALSLKQQLAVQQAAEFQRELIRMMFERDRAKGQLLAHKAQLRDIDSLPVSEYEVTQLVSVDPVMRQVGEQLAFMRMLEAQNRSAGLQGGGSKYLEKSKRDLDIVTAQYEQAAEDLRRKVRDMKRVEIEKETRKLETDAEILEEQVKKFQDDVTKRQAEADKIGKTSIEVEMLRSEVKRLNEILGTISREREQLKVELQAPPRVTIRGESLTTPAERPDSETGRMFRFVLSGLAGLIGLCLPAVGIVLWDLRTGRINAADEVTKSLGVPVIGSLPMIPARVIRQLGSPSPRNQMWRDRLTESVDAITARLLRKSDLDHSRVLLVTSAVGGEGKTTLATQLAMSLARNLRRTVLVDFDLRRPALDGVFGLPLEPGACEALRGQDDVVRMVHPTTTDHLSVLTAGRWDRQILAALANGAAGPLLDQLRANFDFVVLDSSPLLPVADTRFLSQKVDGVVLSVFRDVSQSLRVQSATEILEAFGVRTVEAVVTGGHEPFDGRGTGYGPAETADYTALEAGGPQPGPQDPGNI